MAFEQRPIEFRDGAIVKRQPVEASELEAARLQWAAAVAEENGFYVPKVLGIEDDGSLVLERVQGLVSLMSTTDLPDAERLWRRVGASLMAIHAAPPVAGATTLTLMDVRRATGDNVSLHGDFTAHNCGYVPERDELVILDWLTADWLECSGDVGPAAVDFSTFMLDINYRRFGDPRSPIAQGLQRAFAMGYAGRDGQLPEGLGAVSRSIARRYFRAAFGRRRSAAIARIPSIIKYIATSYWQQGSDIRGDQREWPDGVVLEPEPSVSSEKHPERAA